MRHAVAEHFGSTAIAVTRPEHCVGGPNVWAPCALALARAQHGAHDRRGDHEREDGEHGEPEAPSSSAHEVRSPLPPTWESPRPPYRTKVISNSRYRVKYQAPADAVRAGRPA